MFARLYVYFLNFIGTDPTLASFTYTGVRMSGHLTISASQPI